jgi:hypothetical protein
MGKSAMIVMVVMGNGTSIFRAATIFFVARTTAFGVFTLMMGHERPP